MTKILAFLLLIGIFWTPALAAPTDSNPQNTATTGAGSQRELDWDTYLDKVQGAWPGAPCLAGFETWGFSTAAPAI